MKPEVKETNKYIVVTPIKKNWKIYKSWETIIFSEKTQEVENLIAENIIWVI